MAYKAVIFAICSFGLFASAFQRRVRFAPAQTLRMQHLSPANDSSSEDILMYSDLQMVNQ